MQQLIHFALALSLLLTSLVGATPHSLITSAYAAPLFTVSINNNAEYTIAKKVTLSLDRQNNFTKVRSSNRPFNASDRRPLWQNAATTLNWDLPNKNGNNTVYVQFLDETANTKSAVISDAILLDTQKPKGALQINNNQRSTTGRNVTLRISANDTLSGVEGVRLGNNENFTGRNWQSYLTTASWQLLPNTTKKNESHRVYAQFRDKAGNISTVVSDAIILQDNPALTPTPSPTLAPSPTPTITPTPTPLPPEITSLQPNSGFIGDLISIIGKQFGTFSEQASKVLFQDIPAQVLLWTDTVIEVFVPDGASTGKVVVTNDNGSAQSNEDFTVLTPSPTPTLTPTEIPTPTPDFNALAQKLTVCDATPDGPNPYKQIVMLGHHSSENYYSGISSEGKFTSNDIIPPNFYTNPSNQNFWAQNITWSKGAQNWTAQGEEIWNNGCVVMPTETPTPSPTPLLTITPTQTPDVSPTDIPTPTITPTPIPPAITALQPNTGFIGSLISIVGNHFGSFVEGVSKVFFQDIPATVLSWTDTVIEAIVPDGATTGRVKVANENGQAESNEDFKVQVPALPVINVTGVLEEDQTWTPGNVYLINNVTVPNGITLTIKPGTIVKINSNGIYINNGTLNVQGTEEKRIIITSVDDDSIGGDTNGDGPTETYQNSAAIRYGGENDSTINISFAEIRYARESLNADCNLSVNKITFVDNKVTGPISIYNCTPDKITLQRNIFAVTNTYPIEIYNSDLTIFPIIGLNKNRFSGKDREVVPQISRTYIPVGSTWEYDTTSDIKSLLVSSSLSVYGTLNLKPGTTIKYGGGGGIFVSGGTLNANGTNTKPIIFTSASDDSVGGDSDGNSGSEVLQYPYPIYHGVGNENGKINVSFADIRFAQTSLSVDCSHIETVTFVDNKITSPVHLNGCTADKITLQRNHFAVTNTYPIVISNSDITIASIVGTNKNRFSGKDREVILSMHSTYIPIGTTWEYDTTSDIKSLFVKNYVQVDGILNLKEGTVIKSNNSGGIFVNGGTLNVTGTDIKPVIFTSVDDDSIGGDTIGDGQTEINRYIATIRHGGSNSSTINVSFADMRYTNQSLEVDCNYPMTHVTFVDNKVTGPVSINKCNADKITLQRNNFAVKDTYPVGIYGSDLTIVPIIGPNRNRFSGKDRELILQIGSNYISAGSTWKYDSTSDIKSLFVGRGSGSLQVDGTLNLKEGTIVKIARGYYGSIFVNSGKLNVTGTEAKPVIFTSVDDDSVGGDTNGDGQTEIQRYGAISHGGTDKSTINVSHADMRYADYSLIANCNYPANITFVDNKVTGRVEISNCTADKITLQRNNFAVKDTYPIIASNIDASAILITGNDKNTFTGTDREVSISINNSYITYGAIWETDTTSGLQTIIVSNLSVDGILHLRAGTVIKTAGSTGIFVHDGKLNVSGEQGAPVVLTSIQDDKVGGDSNGDGNQSSPTIGSAGNIVTLDRPLGNDTIVGAVFRYASTAIYVNSLTGLGVENSQFAYNDAAFHVESTTDDNPILSALPCIPPWLRSVQAGNNWFGKNGSPGTTIDILSFGGLFIPDAFGSIYGLGSNMISWQVNSPGVDNTTQWALYHCVIPNPPPLPPTVIIYPVTPVDWLPLLTKPPYPQLAEQ